MTRCAGIFALVLLGSYLTADGETKKADLAALLGKEIIGPRQTIIDVSEFCDARIPRMKEYKTSANWQKDAEQMRRKVLDQVVFRGEAAKWRDAKTKVEWLDTISGGPGYRIKKLRYEALPGMWIPALLYEPEKLTGKVPVSLAVNGHDPNGKAAPYKQIRCINMAKRGMIVLNTEWFGMGQLRTPGFAHGRMNQLDLCGTSGLAPFYLAMKRGLDILLAHEHADPDRVMVSGLSGGGWQTIIISSLDTRVKLANPVAGYSSFRTRIQHLKDMGDSEQTPVDLAAVADYTHLTAMMAPRPTLLTYNSKDDCCFESGYALPPLLNAAGPIFKLFGKEPSLRSHVNDVPGTHNFERDNREALYGMIGDHFYPGDASYNAKEIPSDAEVKKKEDLTVEMPMANEDFHSLAVQLSKTLPKDHDDLRKLGNLGQVHEAMIAKLRAVVAAHDWAVTAERLATSDLPGVRITTWKLRIGTAWTVPCVDLAPAKSKEITLLLADDGRKSTANEVERLLTANQRVLVIDPFYFGECKVQQKDYLFALLISAVGHRPLGVQASQVTAVARWAAKEGKVEKVNVIAIGPRTSLIALVAGALEFKSIDQITVANCLTSLKQIIETNASFEQKPEMFCFGLLQAFDIPHLQALCFPDRVSVRK